MGGISNDETNKELKELKDNTDLINPITGQINNPSIASSDNKEEKKEDKNKNNDDDNQQNKDNDDDNSQNKDDNDIGDDIEKAKKKKKKYAKIKPKYKMIEKPLRQNILKIIDKNKFNLKQEKIKQNELTKTVYSVSLKNGDNDNYFGVLEKE